MKPQPLSTALGLQIWKLGKLNSWESYFHTPLLLLLYKRFGRIHRYRLHVNERPDTGLVWSGLNIWRWLNFRVLLKTINSITVMTMNSQPWVIYDCLDISRFSKTERRSRFWGDQAVTQLATSDPAPYGPISLLLCGQTENTPDLLASSLPWRHCAGQIITTAGRPKKRYW